MNPIVPNIPINGAKISSFLYRSTNPDYLTQDQLTIALPNGYIIDVSWHPEHDPAGHYLIRVFYEFADNERREPLIVEHLDDMLKKVEALSLHYSRQQIPVSSTTTVEKLVDA
jgi:hypothetical protein